MWWLGTVCCHVSQLSGSLRLHCPLGSSRVAVPCTGQGPSEGPAGPECPEGLQWHVGGLIPSGQLGSPESPSGTPCGLPAWPSLVPGSRGACSGSPGGSCDLLTRLGSPSKSLGHAVHLGQNQSYHELAAPASPCGGPPRPPSQPPQAGWGPCPGP